MILSWRKEVGFRQVAIISGTFFILLTGLLLHRYFNLLRFL